MERAVRIQLDGAQLLGILHEPDATLNVKVGVVIVVGGPQYRVGSHRQFVQLSRALAREGIPSLRFDYRGMGDSESDKQPFDDIGEDIGAACDALQAQTGISRIVLWGLCDAASAAMMYAPQDSRVVGLVLLNPWLRSEEAMGKVMVQHYYLKRLASVDFWRKLLRGGVGVLASIKEVAGHFGRGLRRMDSPDAGDGYQQRMERAMRRFDGLVLLVLSSEDLTAREFEQQALGARGWPVFSGTSCRVYRLQGADHTCSSAHFKREVERQTVELVRRAETVLTV